MNDEESAGAANLHRRYELARDRAEAAEQRIRELEAALCDAVDSIEEWGAYASKYFREKWDLKGDVARARAAMGGTRT